MADKKPAAPPDAEDPKAALSPEASPPATPSGGDEGAPTADEAKELRDRLAQAGREVKSSRDRAEQAERAVGALTTKVDALEQTLGGVARSLSERDRAEQEARIAALPPDKRADARVQMLEKRLEALANQQAEATERESRIAYQQRRSREIVEEANRAFGLDGDAAVTGDEEELDSRTEEAFAASLRVLARIRQKQIASAGGNEEDTVATKKTDSSPDEEKIVSRVLQELGAGRPNSPRATGSTAGGVTSEDLHKTLSGYTSRNPQATRGKLKELRERAAEQEQAARV